MYIDRTLFWFKDRGEAILQLNEYFFAFGILLNRLLNENYTGKKIKFINIDFSTPETYDLYPNLPKGNAYYYGGHLRYYGVLNLAEFNTFSNERQKKIIWEKAYEYLQASAKATKNKDLLIAADYAYNKGLKIKLNPDYRMIEADVIIHGHSVKASVWVNFRKDGMYSKLTLENNRKVFLEKDIDKTKNGVEFFLIMYKSIEIDKGVIIIKGRKDVDYLPLKIPIDSTVISDWGNDSD